MKPAPSRIILTYPEARELLKELIPAKTRMDYINWCKIKAPLELARNPRAYYKEEWGGWSHYLGLSEHAKRKKRPSPLPFSEASVIVSRFGLKSREEYNEAYEKRLLPEGMPCRPELTYKGEFRGWAAFLGLARREGIERTRSHKIHTYDVAQEIVIRAGIKSMDEYLRFRLTSEGIGLPLKPSQSYRKKGYRSFEEFLTGKQTAISSKRQIFEFEKARAVAHSQHCMSRAEYEGLARTQSLPSGLPNCPHAVYEGKGWAGWHDFLGIQKSRKYIAYEKARELLSTLGLESEDDYRRVFKALKERGIDDLPYYPESTYKRHGHWQGWEHFLSKSAPRDLESYRQLYTRCQRAFRDASHPPRTKAEFLKLVKGKLLPEFVPSNPSELFSRHGLWTGYRNFLAYESPSFEDAAALIKSKKIASLAEYRQVYDARNLPAGFPRNPESFYRLKGVWKGPKAFYYRTSVKNAAQKGIEKDLAYTDEQRKAALLKYTETKKILKNLGINSISKFRKNLSKVKEMGIPGKPETYFKRFGIWNGYRDLFYKSEAYLNFTEIKKISVDLHRTGAMVRPSISGFLKACKAAGIAGIPLSEKTFRKAYGSHFTSLDDLFQISRPNLDECSAMAKRLQITTRNEWRERYRNQDIPRRYPAWPELEYENFPGWTDFLGQRRRGKGRITFSQAKDLVKALEIKSLAEYRAFAASDVGKELGLPLSLAAYLKHHEGRFSIPELFDRPTADPSQYGQIATVYSDGNPWDTKNQ